MSYDVESDVPLPPRRNRYPFADMEAGQSFAIDNKDDARKVRNAAYQYARKMNRLAVENGEDADLRFSLRKVESDDGEITYRLWKC